MKTFVLTFPFMRPCGRRLAVLLSLVSLFALAGVEARAATYYSQGSLDPGLTTSWNDVRGGGGASPANFTAGDIFVIQNGHNMGTTAAWTVSGAGNKIQIESGGTLQANHLVTTTTFQVDNGGTYIHNNTTGTNGATTDVPGTTRTFGASSTVEYRKWGTSAGAAPVVIPTGPYGNLTLNMTNACGGSINMVGTLTTINGNFTVQNTWNGGTLREFRLTGAANYTLNIGGNLIVTGGILSAGNGAGVGTINIVGNLLITGGWFRNSGTGVASVTNANQNALIISGGGTNTLSGDMPNAPTGPVADAITLDNGAFGADGVDFTLNANRGITLGSGGGVITMSSGRTLTIPGNITGSGGLTKSYISGTTVNLTLSGINDFAGDFTTVGGGVRFNSSAAAGKGRVIVNLAGRPSGGTANVTLRNTGVVTSTLTNDVVFNANDGGLRISLDSDVVNTFVMSGNFSGVGFVEHGINSGGTVVLSGDNSAWSGGLSAHRGTLSLGHKNALGTGTYTIAPVTNVSQMPVSLQAATPLTGANAVTNVVIFAVTNTPGSPPATNTAANFSFLGATDLELSGPITLGIAGSSSPVITNKNSGATILSGVISGAGFGMTIEGTGTLTLKGANTYDGNTVVNGGALVVANTTGSATGSGAVTVNAGATLSGPGFISGPVTINGTVSPGASPGTLTLGGALVVNGTYAMELNSLIPTADKIVANGVTLAVGAQLARVDLGGGTLPPGTSFIIIDNTSGGAVSGTFDGLPEGATFTLLANIYRISYVGGTGNDVVLTVVDTTPPVITCPGPVTVQCDSEVPAPNFAGGSVSDNFDPNPTVTHVGDTSSGTCPKTITRTYKATDTSGNMATCTQTITVHDTMPPVINCGQNETLECGLSWDFTVPIVTDNCGPTTLEIVSTVTNAGCGNTFTATRVWRAIDACNNSTMCTQIVAVVDHTPPAITCPTNITVQCVANVPAPDVSSVTATDLCNTVTVTWEGDTTNGTCPKVITRTYKATDACTNMAICTQTITVHDTTPPTITCPADVTVPTDSGQSTASGVNLGTPVVADNCGVAGVTNNAPATFPVGMTLVTWTVTDACSNAATCTQKVTVVANHPPIAQNDGGATTANVPLSLAFGKLLNNDSDPDGDALTVISVSATSTNGGTVSLTSSNVIYRPLTNFTGTDRFSYTISDGKGGTATAQVEILVVSGNLPSQNQVSLTPTPNGFLVRFAGIPGRTYDVQRSTDLTIWTTLATLVAPLHGIIEYEDTSPPQGTAFYRTAVH